MAVVKWECTWCSSKSTRSDGTRPAPGNCSRKAKTKDGKYKPHTWVKVK